MDTAKKISKIQLAFAFKSPHKSVIPQSVAICPYFFNVLFNPNKIQEIFSQTLLKILPKDCINILRTYLTYQLIYCRDYIPLSLQFSCLKTKVPHFGPTGVKIKRYSDWVLYELQVPLEEPKFFYRSIAIAPDTKDKRKRALMNINDDQVGDYLPDIFPEADNKKIRYHNFFNMEANRFVFKEILFKNNPTDFIFGVELQ